MELKVWCDGIQRVVCGVSPTTTCQDVVLALAHATAQTGRFILIEKWRNNERLLAPNEQPLTVLSKWGEYASDVTFVMMRSNYNANVNENNNTCSTSPVANGNANKKDTFHKILPFSDSSLRMSAKKGISTPTTSTSSSAITSTTMSFTTLNTSHNANNKKCGSATTTTNMNADSTPTKITPQQTQTQTQTYNTNSESNCQSKSHSSHSLRPRHPPPYEEAISKSALITSNSNCNTSHSPINNSSLEERNNKRRSIEPSPQNQKQRSNNLKEQMLHRDAIRLVDMQKETMKTQEKEMTSLEQQITAMERKLLENETLIKRYKDEMASLHRIWAEQEAMISQFDEHTLQEELQTLISDAKKYEEEVLQMKKKLSVCEGDIAECRLKISKLMENLEECGKRPKLDSNQPMTDQMKISIRDRINEFESQIELHKNVKPVKQLGANLCETRTQLSVNNESTIEGLALETREGVNKCDKVPFSDRPGSTRSMICSARQLENAVHQRTGSTRRIVGSPRQLESAVPTNKNPHGVWV